MLSPNLIWELANPKWAAELNPLIGNPMNNSVQLQNVSLSSGTNILNHSLGKKPQGWIITDIQGGATIYRNAPFNSSTLSLSSSASVTVSIGVF